MKSNSEKIIDSLDSNFEYPNEMYFNLNKSFLPLALTIPNKGYVYNFPENIQSVPALDKNQFSLIVSNDKRYRIFKEPNRTSEYLDLFLESDGKYLDPGVFSFLKSMPKDTVNKLDLKQISTFVLKKELFESFVDNIKRKSNEVDDTKPNSPQRIKGILYDGKYIDLKDVTQIQGIVDSLFDSVSNIAVPNETELYRSVRENELREILKNGKYLIRSETNFESKIGPQVQLYLNDPEYAGVMIKTKVEGPYFAHAGFQVPRITSIVPLYADVELSKDGETWCSVKEFIENTQDDI